jgi:membrane-associated phospholipid phosphatase
VIELVIVAALSVVIGVAWGLVVRALPHADPARAASQQLSAELAKRHDLRRFLRARLEPETATGLALTFALVGVLIAGVAFGVLVAMIRSNSGVVNIDISVTRWAAAHATSTSLSVLGWLTQLGGTIGTIVIALATIAYAMRARGRWSIALFVIVVVGGESLLANIIKITVGRVRPDVAPFHVLSGASFPSGHATAAAATWAVVALVFGRGASPRTRVILAGAAAGIAVAVACTRVFLGAHWTSDVIGGVILGWVWFGVCAVAFGGRVLQLGAPVKEAGATAASTTPGDSHSSVP